jgi:hypothetical protein
MGPAQRDNPLKSAYFTGRVRVRGDFDSLVIVVGAGAPEGFVCKILATGESSPGSWHPRQHRAQRLAEHCRGAVRSCAEEGRLAA